MNNKGMVLSYKIVAVLIIMTLTGCTKSEFKENLSSSLIDISELPTPFSGSCASDDLMQWNGLAWACTPASSIIGSPTSSVPATGILPGALPPGVTINANYITPGTIGAGVLLPSTQITGLINPLTQLNGLVCSNNEILKSDGTQFLCELPAGATSVPATGVLPGALQSGVTISATSITPGTLSTGVLLPSTQISGTIALSQLATGSLPSTVALSNISQLPGALSGAGCSNDQILKWSGLSWSCLDESASGGADHLGNHTATENIQLNGHWLSGDGDDEGLRIFSGGYATLRGIGLYVDSSNPDSATFESASTNAVEIIGSGIARLELTEKDASNTGFIQVGADEDLEFFGPGDLAKDMIIQKDTGSVGIGADPDLNWKFQVQNLATTGSFGTGGAYVGLGYRRTSDGAAGIEFYSDNSSNTVSEASIYKGSSSTGNFIIDNTSGGDFRIANQGMWNSLVVSSTGNTGIRKLPSSYALDVNGFTRSSSSTWAVSSDKRVKKKITTLVDGLSYIEKLNPVTFLYKDNYTLNNDKSLKDELQYGFIAQEVEGIIPEAVRKIKLEKIGKKKIKNFRVLDMSSFTSIIVSAVKQIYTKMKSNIKRLDESIQAALNKSSENEERIKKLEAEIIELKKMIKRQ